MRHEEADGVERYLSLLRAGGSDYPMDLLRQAGVDLESAGHRPGGGDRAGRPGLSSNQL